MAKLGDVMHGRGAANPVEDTLGDSIAEQQIARAKHCELSNGIALIRKAKAKYGHAQPSCGEAEQCEQRMAKAEMSVEWQQHRVGSQRNGLEQRRFVKLWQCQDNKSTAGA